MKKIFAIIILLAVALTATSQVYNGTEYRVNGKKALADSVYKPISKGASSNLKSYLPLAGGTMTGKITGPAIHFNDSLKTGINGTISIGEHTISRLSAAYLKSNNGFEVTGNFVSQGYIQNYGELYLRSGVSIRNKTDASWLPFATRNTAGSEAVYDLTNVGGIISESGSMYLRGVSGNGIGFYPGATAKWLLEMNGSDLRWYDYTLTKYVWKLDGATGAFSPYTNNDVDLGTSALKVKDGYFAGTVYTDKLKHSDSDTTGVGSTTNIGTIKYYNGHFYGLKAGAPPTWSQLDN